jgi:uncharacterized protein YjlB
MLLDIDGIVVFYQQARENQCTRNVGKTVRSGGWFMYISDGSFSFVDL